MGQEVRRANIVGISNTKPCTVTTEEAHGFPASSMVRLTDLNGRIPTPRGMDELDGHRYQIKVPSETTMSLFDPITKEEIDATTYPPYVEGGFATMIQTEFQYEDQDE